MRRSRVERLRELRDLVEGQVPQACGRAHEKDAVETLARTRDIHSTYGTLCPKQVRDANPCCTHRRGIRPDAFTSVVSRLIDMGVPVEREIVARTEKLDAYIWDWDIEVRDEYSEALGAGEDVRALLHASIHERAMATEQRLAAVLQKLRSRLLEIIDAALQGAGSAVLPVI